MKNSSPKLSLVPISATEGSVEHIVEQSKIISEERVNAARARRSQQDDTFWMIF